MSDELKPVYQDDEIDLVELLQTLWDGKWTVIAISLFTGVLGGAFAFLKPASFEATTEIKPITSTQAEAYRASNALGFFEVSPGRLQNLFIEQLSERTLFEQQIREQALLVSEDFPSNEEYERAVTAAAADIGILPPLNADGAEKGEVRPNWTIVYEGSDQEKWLSVLSTVTSQATDVVRADLQERFDNSVTVAQQSRAFQLEDLRTQIENAKADFEKQMAEFELTNRFQTEDIQTQIDNSLADYDRKTTDRLAFLREQAAIARQLGVAKNTLEAQTFAASSGVVANVKTDTPFYLRGYEAIEKEIELINSRDDKRSFVEGLFALEQKKRELEQDQTLERAESKKAFLEGIIALERQIREVEQNRDLERAKQQFALTPIADASAFSAAQFDVFATQIESKSKRSLILALAVVLGGMLGVLFVLIRSAVRKRKAA